MASTESYTFNADDFEVFSELAVVTPYLP